MMTALMLLAKASVLVAAVGLVLSIAGRRGSAAMRHECWTLAAIGLLLLPILTFALPGWTVVRMPTSVASSSIANFETSPGSRASQRPSTSVVASVPADEAGADTGGLMTWPTALGTVYVIGALLLLIRLTWQMGTVNRLWRHTMPIDAEWSNLLAECRRELGIRRPVRLFRTADRTIPTAFGILKPTIIIPMAGDNWPAERRRAVMLHELAHVERRDCLTQMVASVACAVYWPHPGVWWLAHRLRVERELACDDLVVSMGTSPRDYAGHLLEVAYALRTSLAPALSASMANPRHLERRMLALLDASRNRATPAVRSRLAVALVAGAVLAAVASATVAGSDAAGPFINAAPGAAAASEAAPGEPAQVTRSAATGLRRGTWEIRPTAESGEVHLRMRDERGFHGHNIAIDRLSGLASSLLTGAGGATGFSIRHDAGTFTFEGAFRNGVGSGTFTFVPDNGFAQMMVARGYDRPTPNQLAMLARQDVGMAFLDELIAQGYRRSTLAQIVRAVEHNIDSGYLRDMGTLGYRVGTIDTLIDMRDHGVSPQYVQGIAAEGLTGLSAWDLIRARDHGVSPEYIRDLGQLGLRLTAVDALVNARDHGVSAEYVRSMRDEGYTLIVDELIRARDHGVSAEYVRDMRGLGYRLRVDQLIWARDHGVSAEYVRDLRGLGYQTLTLDTLIRLRDHGVNPGYIDELSRLGYARLTVDELVSLRDHGVSPDEVRRANTRAGTRLPIPRLLQLADGGWRQSRLELRFTSKLSSLL